MLCISIKFNFNLINWTVLFSSICLWNLMILIQIYLYKNIKMVLLFLCQFICHDSLHNSLYSFFLEYINKLPNYNKIRISKRRCRSHKIPTKLYIIHRFYIIFEKNICTTISENTNTWSKRYLGINCHFKNISYQEYSHDF